jgi:hypothetical protein
MSAVVVARTMLTVDNKVRAATREVGITISKLVVLVRRLLSVRQNGTTEET